jgi:hypothetical protein
MTRRILIENKPRQTLKRRLVLAIGVATLALQGTATLPGVALAATAPHVQELRAHSDVELVCTLLHDCPAITGVTPAFGPSGSVTITGENLSGVTQVMFGAAPALSFRYVPPLHPREQGTLVATTPEPAVDGTQSSHLLLRARGVGCHGPGAGVPRGVTATDVVQPPRLRPRPKPLTCPDDARVCQREPCAAHHHKFRK